MTHNMTHKILVSVIIPTFNRLDYLKLCLDSLFSQSLDKRSYEIIVVDDGSTDNTGSYVKSLQKKFKRGALNLKYYKLNNSSPVGPSGARNLGAYHASGEFLAFLDDDCMAHKSWLNEIVKAFDKYPTAAYIGGYSVLVYKNSFLRHVTSWRRKYGKDNFDRVELLVKDTDVVDKLIYTDNSAIRKSIFFEMGCFDTTLRYCEDCDLCLKLLCSNHAVYRIYSIVVDHYQRDTVRDLFMRQYYFGRDLVKTYRDNFKGYTKITVGPLIHHEYYNSPNKFNVIYLPNIFYKTGWTICITRNFFKEMLFVILLAFFWPILALALFLIIIFDRYIFETKTIKATLSCVVSDIIVQSAFFIGNIVGIFKYKAIRL
jgi:glycosyltransferase involved in cell wall biosynthesis